MAWEGGEQEQKRGWMGWSAIGGGHLGSLSVGVQKRVDAVAVVSAAGEIVEGISVVGVVEVWLI